MLKLNSWKSDLKTRCFMMFLFSIVFVCLRYIQSKHIQAIQYTSIHINTHQYTSIHIQYTSIHINTHQYTSLLTQKKYKTFDVFHDFLGLRCGLCGPSTGALPGRPVVLRGDNDILVAAGRGHLGGVRHLLRTVPGAVATKDRWTGGTALHWPASNGRAEICRVLLAAGAEVDARDFDGLSALIRDGCFTVL